MCEYYDIRVAMSCRETAADEVTDKERANFCGFFEAKSGADRGHGATDSLETRAQLNALFGDDTDGAGDHNTNAGPRSQADIAREQLEQLFGGK